MRRGYIFDCYGTLVREISNAGGRLFLSYFPGQAEQWIHTLMTTPKSIVEWLESPICSHIPPVEQQLITTLIKNDTTTCYEDAHRLLEHCISQNIPFCILTNLSSDYIGPVEQAIGRLYHDVRGDLFEILYSCKIHYKKPQSQAYEKAIDFLVSRGCERRTITMV